MVHLPHPVQVVDGILPTVVPVHVADVGGVHGDAQRNPDLIALDIPQPNYLWRGRQTRRTCLLSVLLQDIGQPCWWSARFLGTTTMSAPAAPNDPQVSHTPLLSRVPDGRLRPIVRKNADSETGTRTVSSCGASEQFERSLMIGSRGRRASTRNRFW